MKKKIYLLVISVVVIVGFLITNFLPKQETSEKPMYEVFLLVSETPEVNSKLTNVGCNPLEWSMVDGILHFQNRRLVDCYNRGGACSEEETEEDIEYFIGVITQMFKLEEFPNDCYWIYVYCRSEKYDANVAFTILVDSYTKGVKIIQT